ncbi:MAG: histidine kinase [Aphanocapsa sp. GSE-SYN-MK-11-07L]|jgi:two-component system clock-associated histidine kinase SasA|nr:histidine kinase [Aphanocapsa sp. GSE-SYN-MK-11-07L]
MGLTPEQFPEQAIAAPAPLQLLLFVEKRLGGAEQIQRIRQHLQALKSEWGFDLKIIDVGEQPYLVEEFKLIATPSLIKLSPEPRQTLAGRNLLDQLDGLWARWQKEAEEANQYSNSLPKAESPSLPYSAELLRLADEVFRLQQDNEALRDQLYFKDRMIAMLAHDLRNPLTATAIALETLENNWQAKDGKPAALAPDMLLRLIHHARTQTQVIERMITNLLLAARGPSADLEIHPKKLDLGHLCLSVLQDLETNFLAKQQQIETDIPSDLPYVHADGDRIRQVMINLLENAIKYTPEQGLIQVSILHRTAQKVQVSICDNGPGIPPENRERIFEDQFRLQRDQHQEGYGIGLALCRRIVRVHYGQIWVDSTPGRGSCFQFTLPVYTR